MRFPGLRSKRPAQRLVPARHVVSTMHGERTVLLDARSGHYYGLDELASRIWSLMQEGHAPHHITELLYDEYDASREELESDVAGFIALLRKSKLLEEA